MRRTLALLVLVQLIVAACSPGEPSGSLGERPSDAVRFALTRLFAHDLVGTAAAVCPDVLQDDVVPFVIDGLFGPTGAWDTGSVAETLALYEFDPAGLSVVDLEGGEEPARVAITGTLRERLDLTAFEARVREQAALVGVPVDEAHIANTLERVGGDWVDLVVDQVVELTRAGDSWRICGPIPSAAPS